MSIVQDLKVLYHMALSPIHGNSHAERLESFYGGQADAYDDFRKRLLHGREALFEALPLGPGDIWVDLGAGTGINLAFLGDRAKSVEKGYLVDLCPSLLEVARKRISVRGCPAIETVMADATTFRPIVGEADLVTFSYSLTMIPDWFAAIDNALDMLKPGGHIGVVDFYVSRKYAGEGHTQHPWITRALWPLWFANDNVHLSTDHLPYLRQRFETVSCVETRAAIPYLPLVRVPYYRFIGRKPA